MPLIKYEKNFSPKRFLLYSFKFAAILAQDIQGNYLSVPIKYREIILENLSLGSFLGRYSCLGIKGKIIPVSTYEN